MIHDWATVIVATLGLVIGGVAAVFTVFETKESARERVQSVVMRLERMEQKLDQVIERVK